MKYLGLLLSFVCIAANAADIPADLMYSGKPIDSLCLFNPEESSVLIKLDVCGIKKEKYTIKDQNIDLIKQGFIGYNWKDTAASYPSEGYSYYKVFPAANKQYWVYTINNGGGNGDFTAINLVQRKTPTTLEIKTIATGDRCNNGIQDVKQQNYHLSYSVNLTAFDFLTLTNQNPHNIKAYDDLPACAACCAAKAIFEVSANLIPKLIYVDMGTNKNPDEMSTQGKYHECFNNLFVRYVTLGKTKLNEAQLKQFVTEFNEKCI